MSHMSPAIRSGGSDIQEERPVKDALYVVLMLGFFAASVVLVYALDRLRGGSKL